MRKMLATVLFVLLGIVSTAAQVPNFPQTLPANTVVGRLGIGPGPSQPVPFATLASSLRPLLLPTGTGVIYASDYGVVCDGGTTDNTSALNTFFAALSNLTGIGGVKGILPAGDFCGFTDTLTMPARNDWALEGAGGYTSVLLYNGASTTKNLLVVGDGISSPSRFKISNLRVATATTMTAGTAIWLRQPTKYILDNVTVGAQDTVSFKVWNGIWADTANFGQISGSSWALNDALRANTGAELNVDNFVAETSGAANSAAVHLGGGFGGLYTGYVTIVGTYFGLLVDTALDAAGNNQIFISNRTTIDQSTGHGVYLNDNVSSNKAFMFAGWSASTQNNGNGIAIVNWANGTINLAGSTQLVSNQGDGIYTNDATAKISIDAAANISGSGFYGVFGNVAVTVYSSAANMFSNGSGNYNSNVTVRQTQAGYLDLRAVAAPSSPSSGYGVAWFDSTDLRFHDKNASGTIGTTVVADTGSSQLLTGLSAAGVLSKISIGTGVATALGINVGTAGAFVVNGGALGTPSSGTLTNATGLPISTGISGLGTGVATALAVNTGTAGAFVVNGGALGTPSSGTATNLSGTATSLTAGNATNTAITDDTSTNATMYPTCVTTASGNQALKVSSTGADVEPEHWIVADQQEPE